MLSARELEILEHAAAAMTDQQIAVRLNIRPSTVNSYWVRIRGKMGQTTRTEFVATVIRDRVRAQLEGSAQAESKESIEYGWIASALDCLPEAVLAVEVDGHIAHANMHARRVFGLSMDESRRSVEDIIPAYAHAIATSRLLDASDPTDRRIGG